MREPEEKTLAFHGAFSNRISFVNLFSLDYCPGSRFSPRSESSAATSGTKHERCKVHSELTRVASLRAHVRSRPHLRPAGNDHIRDMFGCVFSTNSGRDRLVGRTERFSGTPDAVQNYRELSGKRHSCLAWPRSLSDRAGPIAQARRLLDPRQNYSGCFVQQCPRKPVTASRYPTATIHFSGLILSRRKSQVRADRSRFGKSGWIFHRADICKGG